MATPSHSYPLKPEAPKGGPSGQPERGNHIGGPDRPLERDGCGLSNSILLERSALPTDGSSSGEQTSVRRQPTDR